MSQFSAPQELIDTIIDELQDDYLSLMSCSLVSRSFSSQTRPHLFRHIDLAGGSLSAKFRQLTLSSPHIPGYVKDLTIFDNAFFEDRHAMGILKSLVNLGTIELRHSHVSSLPKVADVLSNISIRSVVLSFTTFLDVSVFCTLMNRCFPGMSNLEMSNVHVLATTDAVFAVPQRSCAMETLKIKLDDVDYPMLEAISEGALGALTKLHTLSTTGCPEGDAAAHFQELLSLPSLRVLRLRNLQYGHSLPDPVSLLHLQTIVLNMICLQHYTHVSPLRWLASCLSLDPDRISSLQHITIIYTVYQKRGDHLIGADVMAWAALDRLLSHPRMSALRSFRVVVDGIFGHPEGSIFHPKTVIEESCAYLQSRDSLFTVEVVDQVDYDAFQL
ncbi:uncharacterized protein EV420DRAFT_1518400 [Desarmillaria tabescens]|uniref:F-box domain-containing protein n=1 Tax=Armillaria tabescens TaxID=1929756 RepID=A0AA39NDI3_ARMTA|nr:uncharacterized protein EV420DRAFT_1518400 [Desarmillaria tabescens]KAK0463478.1 hypothetical protein EV420DRAFT_1518400 [Desarmillaria tabescens]